MNRSSISNPPTSFPTLLPCPFCGKAPTIICPDNSYGSAMVTCGDVNECPVDLTAWGDLATGETIEDAIEAWNTRPQLPCTEAVERDLAYHCEQARTYIARPAAETPEGHMVSARRHLLQASDLLAAITSLTSPAVVEDPHADEVERYRGPQNSKELLEADPQLALMVGYERRILAVECFVNRLVDTLCKTLAVVVKGSGLEKRILADLAEARTVLNTPANKEGGE